ncbi:undecaprenyldiphospho-muramoylpentapeptide beta-N-acetylglucosaminyltransferase [Parapedomonas caeni]
MTDGNRHVVIAAGGTGGHMVPAHAVAHALMAQDYEVTLVTDDRGLRFPGLFDGIPKHVIASGSPSRGGPLGWLSALLKVREGRAAARRLFQSYHPAVVAGFGGYPALPALLAALSLRIPTVIHEQNAVLGRVNRLLAGRVDVIATSFQETARLNARHALKVSVTGNPVRADVAALRALPFPDFHEESVFRVLVVGGSQGAKVLSDVVPAALEMLPVHLRRRLQVTQQCREEDVSTVRQIYARLGIAAECATYITDMAARLKWAHLVIARAGASTLSELTAVGRPAILVPLPSATDDHQSANAREMAQAGGARVIPQARFTPAELAKQIQKIALEPGALANAAARARALGHPLAAHALAGIIARLAGGPWSDVRGEDDSDMIVKVAS